MCGWHSIFILTTSLERPKIHTNPECTTEFNSFLVRIPNDLPDITYLNPFNKSLWCLGFGIFFCCYCWLLGNFLLKPLKRGEAAQLEAEGALALSVSLMEILKSQSPERHHLSPASTWTKLSGCVHPANSFPMEWSSLQIHTSAVWGPGCCVRP